MMAPRILNRDLLFYSGAPITEQLPFIQSVSHIIILHVLNLMETQIKTLHFIQWGHDHVINASCIFLYDDYYQLSQLFVLVLDSKPDSNKEL